jgi:dTDP-4-amino-4,6-dideoxygalactose transaminase
VASGTAALQLALLAAGVGPGDEVITTAHTFIATAEAITHCGATPVFADIDPDTFNIDPELIEPRITARTRAIVPVHLYGQPARLEPILGIARRHGLRVIEDAAQAAGSEVKGKRCGSIGDLASFSFYPGKNLGAYGDAGAVTGNDPALVAKVQKLRDHGRVTKYEHDDVGYGERLDALQAAILRAKLGHLEDWTEARRRNAAIYDELLEGSGVEIPSVAEGMRHVYHLYVIKYADRDRLLDHLKSRGIGAGIHYPIPVHRQPAYAAKYEGLSLPATEAVTAQILSLPMYPELTAGQIEHVVKSVREVTG